VSLFDEAFDRENKHFTRDALRIPNRHRTLLSLIRRASSLGNRTMVVVVVGRDPFGQNFLDFNGHGIDFPFNRIDLVFGFAID